MIWVFQAHKVWKGPLDLLEFLDNLVPQDFLDRKEKRVILAFQALVYQVFLAQRVNLVYLDTQETQASKVPWEILVCLGYQGPLEQKDNQAFLDFQEPQAFPDQKVSLVLQETLAFQENLVL